MRSLGEIIETNRLAELHERDEAGDVLTVAEVDELIAETNDKIRRRLAWQKHKASSKARFWAVRSER